MAMMPASRVLLYYTKHTDACVHARNTHYSLPFGQRTDPVLTISTPTDETKLNWLSILTLKEIHTLTTHTQAHIHTHRRTRTQRQSHSGTYTHTHTHTQALYPDVLVLLPHVLAALVLWSMAQYGE